MEVYIIPMQNNVKAMEIANKLRKNNFNVDIDMNNWKIKKALKYAAEEAVPFVVIVGEDELKQNKVVIKNMLKNSQSIVDIEQIVEELKAL